MPGGTRFVVVMLMSTLVTGCASEPQAAAAPETPAPVTAGPESEGLLLHGVVTRDGEPMPDVDVRVSLWPNPDDTEVGEAVDTFDVDPDLTDADGRWTAYVDAEEVPSRYLDAHTVNTDLLVTHGESMATWGIPLKLLPRYGVWRSGDANVADDAMRVDIDLAAETITITESGVTEAVTSELPFFGPD